jgi:hypothetical protein
MIQALLKNKHFIVIAFAAMVIMAYAVPYGIDVEAKKGENNGNHYGQTYGYGEGLDCSHFKNIGPLRCR